jgi:CDP-diacylglycerol--glycerol-3-phosphate 3-phosphatidyltransferase
MVERRQFSSCGAAVAVVVTAAAFCGWSWKRRHARSPVIRCGLELFRSRALDPSLTDRSTEERLSPTAADEPTAAVYDSLYRVLDDACCRIPLDPSKVDVLRDPPSYYHALKACIAAARERIVLSALFIGDGRLSRELVAALVEAVERRQRDATLPALAITLLLDHNRMRDQQNLATLKPLLEAGAAAEEAARGSVRLVLFQTPTRAGRYLRRVGRACEVLGVQHTKIAVFDGRDLILTGANLSDDYFTTRMDRYLVVRDNPAACWWYERLVEHLCALGHPVSMSDAPPHGEGARREPRSGLWILPPPGLSGAGDALGTPSVFAAAARARLQAFAAEVGRHMAAIPALTPPHGEGCSTTTWLFPTMQFGGAGVYHDSSVIEEVLRLADASTPGVTVTVTSPYLNFFTDFVDRVVASRASFRFVTAAVATNAWCGQRGAAGCIPYLYLGLQRAFRDALRDGGCSDRVTIFEFSQPGVTFHAKGLWMQPRVSTNSGSRTPREALASSSEDESDSAPSIASPCPPLLVAVQSETPIPDTPILAAYGSSNYGHRSVHRDVEAQAFVLTADPALRAAFGDELDRMMERCQLAAAVESPTAYASRLPASILRPFL